MSKKDEDKTSEELWEELEHADAYKHLKEAETPARRKGKRRKSDRLLQIDTVLETKER